MLPLFISRLAVISIINLKPLLSEVFTNIKKKQPFTVVVELLLNNGVSDCEVIICFGTKFKLSVHLTVIDFEINLTSLS